MRELRYYEYLYANVILQILAVLNQGWQRRYPSNSKLSASYSVLQVPPLLWSQFYHVISSFLELRMGIGQTLVYRWSCRVLKDVATNIFLNSEENRVDKIFMQLADYFKGTAMKPSGVEGHSHEGMFS